MLYLTYNLRTIITNIFSRFNVHLSEILTYIFITLLDLLFHIKNLTPNINFPYYILLQIKCFRLILGYIIIILSYYHCWKLSTSVSNYHH